jgi:eukaryotic-like serine/threonine-protein kinase
MQKAQRTPWGAFSQFLFGSLFLFSVVTLTACGAPPLPHTTVYVVSQYGTVYAVKSQDGSIRWRSDMSRDQRSVWSASAGLTLINGVIYTSSSEAGGYLYAIQPQDGNVRWQVRVHPEGTPSPPVVIDGVGYVCVLDPSLRSSYVDAFRTQDGSLLWQTRIRGAGLDLTVVDHSIYLGTSSNLTAQGSGLGYVYALDTSHGSVRWHAQLSNFTSSGVVVLSNTVYVEDSSGTVSAFSTANGSLLWHRHIQTQNGLYLAAAHDLVYVSTADGSLAALRAKDGGQQWNVHVGDHGPYNPTVIGDVIYAESPYDETLYALQARTGTPLWSYQATDSTTGGLPVVVNGVVYFSMQDGIYALTESHGDLIYHYYPPNPQLYGSLYLAIGP